MMDASKFYPALPGEKASAEQNTAMVPVAQERRGSGRKATEVET
jgi:hypothetical protein